MSLSLRNQELKFGSIKEVNGSSIMLHADHLELQFDGNKYCAEVGAYINCGGTHGNTICTISKVQIVEVESGKQDTNTIERKVVTLAILGCEVLGKFSRGVRRLPTINCNTYFLSSDQVNKLIGIDLDEDKEHFCVTDKTDDNQTYLNLDKLMGRHTAILGTTGSGKSCTVASIVQSMLSSYDCPRILFFDIHNEYPSAFGFNNEKPDEELKSKTNAITWKDFCLPYWFLDLDEFLGVYSLDRGSVQRAIIKEHISNLKEKQVCSSDNYRISVDSPVFFDINDLIFNITEERDALVPSTGKPEKNATEKKTYTSIILKLESIESDSRYSFLHNKISQKTSISQYFEFLLGLTDNQ